MLVQKKRIRWLLLEELQQLDHQYLLRREDQLLSLVKDKLEKLHREHEARAILRTRRNEELFDEAVLILYLLHTIL